MSGRPPSAFDSPARDEQLARPARRGRSSMPAVPPAAARPGVPELLDEAARLLDARLRLGGARLGAAPQPLDLAADGVGQRLLVGGLAAQELVAAGEELAVPPVGLEQAVRVGAVQLEHARGHVLEEVAVVAHDEDGARPIGENALQPEDAIHVEVVGGLVQQQDVGRAPPARARWPGASSSRPTASSTAARPSAKPARPSVCAMRPGRSSSSTVGQGGGEHILDGAAGREDRILRNVADADAAANGAGAAVGRLDPGQDLEEGGLAGAVRAHEAHLVSVEEAERQLVEERPGPVGLADRLAAQEQRPGHLRATAPLGGFTPHHCTGPARRMWPGRPGRRGELQQQEAGRADRRQT